jgi:apolipoprotein N-acyltransferase
MGRWARIAALVGSGAAQAVLLPPISAWWCSPVALLPAFWALQGGHDQRPWRGWRALGAGWLLGTSSVLALGYWIAPTLVHFGGLSWAMGGLALLAYAIVFGGYAGVFAAALAPVQSAAGVWWPFAAAALWVSCEFLNPQLFAHYLGLSFWQRPEIFLLTSVTGIAGPSFLIVLVNGLIAAALRARRIARAPALVALGLVALCVGHGRWRSTLIQRAQPAAPTRRIALLQDNLGPRARAALSRQGPQAIAAALVAQSRPALAAHPGTAALVWAESALPGTPLGENSVAVRDLVRDTGVELWTGGHAWEGERRFNAAFRVHGAGLVDPPYRKNVLIPFGEYLPLADAIPWLHKPWAQDRNWPGSTQPVFEAPAGRFAFLICYEAIKSGYVRKVARQAAPAIDLLVNLTYDGWFGATSCPHLHLAAAALQSAQFGLPMARVSSTGISAFIDARGVVTARTDLFTPALLVADVPRFAAGSLYRRCGDCFAWLCVAVTAALLVGGAARANKSAWSTSGGGGGGRRAT